MTPAQQKLTAQLPLLCVLLAMPFFAAQGQPPQILFEKSHFNMARLHIHDACEAYNGMIYIAGEAASISGDLDGVLLALDPETGELQKIRTYGGGNDDGLRAIVPLPNGRLCLLGYSASKSQTMRRPWMLQVDLNGLILLEKDWITPMHRSFSHAAVGENGELLVAGFDGNPADGKIWLSPGLDQELLDLRYLGNNLFEDIRSMFALSGGGFFLCGNFRPAKNIATEASWYMMVNPEGNKIQEGSFGQRKWEKIAAASEGPGHIRLAGETWRKGEGESDVWLLKLNPATSQLIEEKTQGGLFEDFAENILVTLSGDPLVAMRTVEGPRYKNLLMLFPAMATVQPNTMGEVQIAKLLLSCRNKWIALGNAEDRKQNGMYHLVLQPPAIRAKGAIRLEYEPPVFGADNNGDGRLSPGEEGALVFTINNPGQEPVADIRVKTRFVQSLNGLSAAPEVFVAAIPVGGKRKVFVPVRAGQNLQAGNAKLELQVFTGAQLVQTLSATIPAVLNQRAVTRQVSWVDPDPIKNPTREIRTSDAHVVLKARGNSDRPSDALIKRIVLNGVRLDDNKQGLIAAQSGQDGAQFLIDFFIDIPLDTGRNEIVLEIYDGETLIQSSPVVVFRNARKPKLHVLTIAPPYDNLRFNRKDADDFSQIIARQGQSGLYDTVLIQRLHTAETTSRTQLEVAFNDLYNRSQDRYQRIDRIDPQDVLIIFISSHGILLDGKFRLLPSNYDATRELATTIDFRSMMEDYLSAVKAKVLIMIDACHSGGAKSKSSDLNISEALNQLLSASPGKLIISSSSKDELSYEDEAWENGLFTEVLLEALTQTAADANTDGFLSPAELVDHLQKRVSELAEGIRKRQTPSVPRSELDMQLKLFRVRD